MLLEGKFVQLGDLGTFGFAIKTNGVKTPSDFTANDIKDVTVIWYRGEDFKTLRRDAVFNYVASRNAQAVSKEEEKSQTTIVKGDLS